MIIINEVAIYLRKSRGESKKDLLKHKMLLVDLCKQNRWKYVNYEEIESADTIEYRPKSILPLVVTRQGYTVTSNNYLL
jgi:site-specific DNA recombinase